MRGTPNLSDALTSLDWADRQIDVFTAEVSAFTQANPYTTFTEKQPNGWTNIYVKTDVPIAKRFAPSINAIIQAQRSSLDYLVVALAEANGAKDPTDQYFPVVRTKEGLSDKRTLKKLSLLDPADQKAILDLRPYAGGNDTLYALHALNVERKHRRLGLVVGAIFPQTFGLGAGSMRGLMVCHPGNIADSPYLIAVAQFEGDLYFQVATEITFRKVPGAEPNPAVIPTLREFSTLCRDIIALFD